MCGSAIQVQVTTMKIPCRATSSAPNGDRKILEYMTSGAAPTSPPEGVLRRTQHMQAVRTHHGPIYGSTGHAKGGKALQAHRELIYRCHCLQTASLSVTTTCRVEQVRAAGGLGWTSPPPPPGSARLARASCGPDGAAGGRGPERFRLLNDHATFWNAIGGTARLELRSSSTAAITSGPRHYQ